MNVEFLADGAYAAIKEHRIGCAVLKKWISKSRLQVYVNIDDPIVLIIIFPDGDPGETSISHAYVWR